jgi:hypothetical protein
MVYPLTPADSKRLRLRAACQPLKILSSLWQVLPGEKSGQAVRYKYAKTARKAFCANPTAFRAVCRANKNEPGPGIKAWQNFFSTYE